MFRLIFTIKKVFFILLAWLLIKIDYYYYFVSIENSAINFLYTNINEFYYKTWFFCNNCMHNINLTIQIKKS